MTRTPKIAILLGAYNAEKYLEEQLDSILNQTYKNWILYIRDDFSTDQTKKIIESYSAKFANIVMVDDSLGNLGCNGNYFHLLNQITEEYYMFCNADDYWLEDKIKLSIERMLEVEEKNPDVPIIVHTDLAITDAKLKIIYESLWKFDNLIPEKFANYNDIGISCIVAGATALFNNKAKNLTFPVPDDAPFFDHWMALQVTKHKGIISSIHIPTIYYRQIGTNLAAIPVGEKNTIVYKIKNIAEVYKINKKEADMLKSVKWGGYSKFLFYKIKIIFITRFLNKV